MNTCLKINGEKFVRVVFFIIKNPSNSKYLFWLFSTCFVFTRKLNVQKKNDSFTFRLQLWFFNNFLYFFWKNKRSFAKKFVTPMPTLVLTRKKWPKISWFLFIFGDFAAAHYYIVSGLPILKLNIFLIVVIYF